MNRSYVVRRIVSYYARPASFSTGGVNTSRYDWMRELAKSGIAVTLIDARGGFEAKRAATTLDHGNLDFETLTHAGRSRMSMIPIRLGKALRTGDLVYLHEGWTPSNLVAAAVCRKRHIPYIILPHGVYAEELTRELRYFPVRRRLEQLALENSAAVHLFFEDEVPELHRIAPEAHPLVSMTGIRLPREKWAPDDTAPYFAWLGRYDIRHKGIDNLVAAFQSLSPSERPRLKMRGPDHLGDKAIVKTLVANAGLENYIDVGPEIAATEVSSFLTNSNGFIHVPRWEAFGRTIVEAIARGLPVLLGDGAHISVQLGAAGAALVVDSSDPISIAHGIRQLPIQGPHLSAQALQWAQDELEWGGRAAAVLRSLARDPSLNLKFENGVS